MMSFQKYSTKNYLRNFCRTFLVVSCRPIVLRFFQDLLHFCMDLSKNVSRNWFHMDLVVLRIGQIFFSKNCWSKFDLGRSEGLHLPKALKNALHQGFTECVPRCMTSAPWNFKKSTVSFITLLENSEDIYISEVLRRTGEEIYHCFRNQLTNNSSNNVSIMFKGVFFRIGQNARSKLIKNLISNMPKL